MRNISFMLTQAQVVQQTKTVTRRLGWALLEPGTILQPVEKSQGLKRGEKVVKLGCPVRIIRVTFERLEEMGKWGFNECFREGFPSWRPSQFIAFFCKHNACVPGTIVTRIEFEYIEKLARHEAQPPAPQHDGASAN